MGILFTTALLLRQQRNNRRLNSSMNSVLNTSHSRNNQEHNFYHIEETNVTNIHPSLTRCIMQEMACEESSLYYFFNLLETKYSSSIKESLTQIEEKMQRISLKEKEKTSIIYKLNENLKKEDISLYLCKDGYFSINGKYEIKIDHLDTVNKNIDEEIVILEKDIEKLEKEIKELEERQKIESKKAKYSLFKRKEKHSIAFNTGVAINNKKNMYSDLKTKMNTLKKFIIASSNSTNKELFELGIYEMTEIQKEKQNATKEKEKYNYLESKGCVDYSYMYDVYEALIKNGTIKEEQINQVIQILDKGEKMRREDSKPSSRIDEIGWDKELMLESVVDWFVNEIYEENKWKQKETDRAKSKRRK